MNRIIDYYKSFDEWSRLESPSGRIEFARMMTILTDSMTEGESILDIGGGPGRYTIALANAGYAPQLADLSPKNIEVATEKLRVAGLEERVPEPLVASVTNLSAFADNSFDVVLALGPFYHLISLDDRIQALQEISRVLKPNGKAFLAFIPRLSGVAGLFHKAAFSPEQVQSKAISRAFESGVFQNSSRTGFQDGYFMGAAEARQLFAKFFVEIKTQSIKGLFANREDLALKIQQESPELYGELLSLVEESSSQDAVIDSCDHAVFIGRKEMDAKA